MFLEKKDKTRDTKITKPTNSNHIEFQFTYKFLASLAYIMLASNTPRNCTQQVQFTNSTPFHQFGSTTCI